MSSVTIRRSDGSALSIVSDRVVDTTACTLELIGRGYVGDWVTSLNNNLVTLLENSAGTIAPAAPLDGQLWWNRTTQALNVYSGSTWEAVGASSSGADLAERYAADEPMEPGDVVDLGGKAEITRSSTLLSEKVFGVISTAPAFYMNTNAGTSETHPFVALTGRVPCKVVGRVQKGQRLVCSSVRGYACASFGGSTPFSVVGRALADKTTDGPGMLEIVVGRL